MKVVMIGGTGYLGYFSVRELVKAGHQVTAIGLPRSQAFCPMGLRSSSPI